jgi:ABC-type polysaccharide/polyol phosphate export permease
VLPNRAPDIQPYYLFLFCGILPWTWFSSSLAESSGVILGSSNLVKKVLFPAEVLPTVTVLSNLVHFLLGLPILLAFLAW